MLVLTRKLKEQILIGDDRVVITILEVGAGRVRIGIDAPKDVSIRRREIEVEIEAPVPPMLKPLVPRKSPSVASRNPQSGSFAGTDPAAGPVSRVMQARAR